MTAALLLAACLYCDPPTAADPWQDRDVIPKTLVFPKAERDKVERGYPFFTEKSDTERDWVEDHGKERSNDHDWLK